MEYLHCYNSPLGGITIASDGKTLTGLWFDGQKYFADTLEKDHEEKALPVFDQADRWLDIYFSGRQPGFTPIYQLYGLTQFRREVSEILCSIPFGKTRTYGDIADQIAQSRGIPKMSAQAVGGAVGWNPICIIIPCHRVLGAGGNLTGYGGGLENKKALLELEGNDISEAKL